MSAEPMVVMEAIEKVYARGRGRGARGFALRDVNLTVRRGEVVGLLGESGSGKSTLASIMMLLTRFDAGRYTYRGEDVSCFSQRERFRFKSCTQIVFQDPYGSLNPRASVEEIVGESLILHQRSLDRSQRRERVAALLHEVGLPDADLARYPHAFSGGQRQRIAIARALAVEPELLLCDEPLSSLDVSIQAQIIELFARLVREHALTVVFITHDLNVARLLCDRVYVMHDGRIVEEGPARETLTNPREPYTARLLEAVY